MLNPHGLLTDTQMFVFELFFVNSVTLVQTKVDVERFYL